MPSILHKKLNSIIYSHEVLTTAQFLETGISDQSITRMVKVP